MIGKTFLKRFRPGILLVILSCLGYAIASIAAASIVTSVGSSNIVGFRNAVQGLVAAPLLFKEPEKKFSIPGKEIFFVLLSGFSLGISAFTFYWSYEFIPVVDSTAISKSQIVVVFIVSGIWLKEKIGIYEIATMISVIVGVFVISQPTFLFTPRNPEDYNGLSLSWFGYFLAVLTTVGGGLTTSFIKRAQAAGPVMILSLQGLIVLPMLLIFSQVLSDGNDPKDSYEWLYLLIVTVCSGSARILVTCSLMYEDSSLISVLSTSEIVITLILQMIFLDIMPNWISIVGALLIVLGVVCLQMKSQILNCFTKKTSEEEKNLI